MDLINKQAIVLDFRQNTTAPIPHYTQFDSNVLEFIMKDNGADADLSNIDRIVVNVKRPDGVITSRLLEAVDNIITYDIGNEETKVEGYSELVLQFYTLEDLLSTKRIKIYFGESLGAEFEQGEGLPLLQELFVEVADAMQLINDTNTVFNDSETIRLNNEASRENAESARLLAETDRVGNEQTRESNEGDRTLAESERITAEDIREQNEDTRESNELIRQSQEAARQSNTQAKINEVTTRITELNDVDAVQFHDRQDQFDQQLADITTFVNIKSFGAVGDGAANDTQALLDTITFATTHKLKIYVPKGQYLIESNLFFENNTFPEIFGDGLNLSRLLFANITGFALTIGTYYNQPFKIKGISIEQKDVSETISGLKIRYPAGTQWGACVYADDFKVLGFTDIILNLVNTFSFKFSNCIFEGGRPDGIKTAKILKIDKISPEFSNVGVFDNCTFSWAKIGIQNLGGVGFEYNACTFTGLELFGHFPSVSGMDASRQTFQACWFEAIDKGILNADINEETLTPITPITNKLELINMRFINNNAAFMPPYILDELIEPINYDISQFFLFNGFSVNLTRRKPQFTTVPLLNGWTGTLDFYKDANNLVTLKGSIKPGTQTALTQIAVVPAGSTPYTTIVIPANDSPNGNSANRFYLAGNGTLAVPADQSGAYSSAFTYNFQVTYVAD